MAYLFQSKRYRLPLHTPVRTAHGVWRDREGILVRLEDEQGRVGHGEIAPIPWFGTETVDEAEAICRQLGNRVEAAALDGVPVKFGAVRFGLSQARQFELINDSPSRLPVAALLPAGSDAVKILRRKMLGGYLTYKWKVGVGDLEDELGILDDLLSILPPHMRLRLDANGAWTRKQAAKWLERCADRPIEFIEQPVAPDDEASLLGLAADYPVKLGLDESVTGLEAARRWQSLGWTGVFVMKPALAGSLEDFIRWVVLSRADVVLSSAIETALGRAAIFRAALLQPLTRRALGFGLGEMFGDRRFDGPVTGPLLDASWAAAVQGEELWNAVS